MDPVESARKGRVGLATYSVADPMTDRTPSCIRMAEVGVLGVLPDHLCRRTVLSVGHQVAGPHGQDDVADGVQDQLRLLVLDVVAALGGDH